MAGMISPPMAAAASSKGLILETTAVSNSLRRPSSWELPAAGLAVAAACAGAWAGAAVAMPAWAFSKRSTRPSSLAMSEAR